LAQGRALHQDLFMLLAVVGIAVGGFLIGISVFVSTAVSTAPVIPDSEPPVVIPPVIEPPEVEPPVAEPPDGVEPPVNGQPVVEDPPLPPAQGDHPAAEALRLRVGDFHLALGEKDVQRMMEFYSSANPFAEWGGQSGVFAGTYPGFNNVRLLWASVIGNTETIESTFTDYSASFVGDTSTVSYELETVGRGKLVGDFSMVIDVVTVWDYVNGRWVITDDRWDFVIFEVEIVAQGTVFPLHWQKRGDFSVWDERIARLFSP